MAVEGIIQRSFGGGELAPALHARADQVKYTQGARQVRNWIVRRAGGVSNRPGTRYIATCKTNAASTMLLRYKSEIPGESVLIEAGSGYLRFYVNGVLQGPGTPAAWGGATQYFIGDLVSSGGVNYYAVLPSLNQAPPNATFWYPMPAGILELPSPFGTAGFYWSQTGRIITMTEDDTQPHELEFVSLTNWIIRKISTKPTVDPPANVAVVVGSAGTRRVAYVVTAALAETYEESEASGQAINLVAGEATMDAPHVITWDAVVGAAEYYVYSDPYDSGTYGFIGTSTGAGLSFNDVGFEPDYGVTPPVARILFTTTNNFPAVSASYKQRRFFGNTKATPDAVFGSRIGFRSNFGIASPLQDDDAISFKIAGEHAHPIRHLIGLKPLIVMTDGGGWSITGDQGTGLTPSSINPNQETYAGAFASVRPVVVGNSIIYVQSRGSIVRDLQFNQEVEGLNGRDLTIFASHLVDGHTIRRMDYAETPDSIIWCCRDDGRLLGLTYLREHEVWGWHRHDTESGVGVFHDVCVVPEGDRDSVYFLVSRTVNAAQVLYIERLEPREILNFDEDVFFVDSGLSYSGAPVANVSGAAHIRGKVVAVVGDGEVLFDGDPNATNAADFTITAGGALPVNLPAVPGKVAAAWSATVNYTKGDIVTQASVTYYAVADGINHVPPNASFWSTTPKYSNIHLGLPIRFADLETLDLDVQGTDIRSRRKRVNGISVLIDASSRAFKAGPDSTHLRTYSPPPHEGDSDEFTGQVELEMTATYDYYGRVLVRQTDPLPITVLAIVPQVEGGG